MTPGRRSLLRGVALALLAAAGCGDGPVDPGLPELEVVPILGQGEFGVVGQELRLEAVVVGRDDGLPRAGVRVAWEVERGEGVLVPGSSEGTLSDEGGVVWTRVRLGDVPGELAVRVRIEAAAGTSALFTLTAGDAPRLDAVLPAGVTPGAEAVVEGAGFREDPQANVVLFGGIRAAVTEAAPERLRVVVPPCLPAREVAVTVQLGSLVSEAVTAAVEADGGHELALTPGAWLDDGDPAAPGCLRLPGGGRYLVVGFSASTVAGARYPVTTRGLSARAPVAAPGALPRPGGAEEGGGEGLRWERIVRAREDALARKAAERAGAPAAPAAAAVPEVGHRRTFRVLNVEQELEEVTAVARHVGSRAAIYVDEDAPAGGFTDADLEAFSRRFDEVIHPTVTDAFGAVSDLDGNERVVILFTPVVNRLTERGADGLVGGFFFGLDLLPGEGGNDGEVFYALVPDPDGIHSEPRSTERVLEVVPAVLAHEFQHMVHHNQRVLQRGGVGNGALWVSEGLAHMAEELVARAYADRGEPADVELFRAGNRTRARRYLADPADVSLIVSSGRGSLAERGGDWLFILYLADRWGGDVLAALTATTRTGVANVTAVTGEPWPGLLADWWSALALDGAGEGAYGFQFPTVDLPALLADGGDPDLIRPERVGAADFLRADTLWSVSARHYIVETPEGVPLVLRMAGGEGGAAASGSELALRLVRLF